MRRSSVAREPHGSAARHSHMGTTCDVQETGERARYGRRIRWTRRRRRGIVAARGVIAVGLVLGTLAACSADAHDDDSAAATVEHAADTVVDAPASAGGSADGGLAEVGGFDLDAIGRDLAI